METGEILLLLTIHWIADFIFQDEKWALGKSKNWNDLLSHTTTYSLIWIIPMLFLLPLNHVLVFWFITFVAHTITDYYTSRIVSKKFAKQEFGSSIPNFGAFTIIGFDQLLHFIQIFLTYQLLK